MAGDTLPQEYPETVRVSSGLALTVEVKFRPVVEEAYHDHIQVVTPNGTFPVEVIAVLPRPSLSFPEVSFSSAKCQVIHIHSLGLCLHTVKSTLLGDPRTCPPAAVTALLIMTQRFPPVALCFIAFVCVYMN